jgi:hypothetical protein
MLINQGLPEEKWLINSTLIRSFDPNALEKKL